jgi:hypothetical protein
MWISLSSGGGGGELSSFGGSFPPVDKTLASSGLGNYDTEFIGNKFN